MTSPTLSCEQFADALADFLERDVDEATRARMDSHALSCDDCGPLLADLRSLRIDAAYALLNIRSLFETLAQPQDALLVGGIHKSVKYISLVLEDAFGAAADDHAVPV